MPTPINRPPVGFNELLQLQTKGHNPNMLSDQVIPIIDYETFIRNNIEWRIKLTSFTMDTGDNNSEIGDTVVPEGDLWVVANVSVFGSIAGTATAGYDLQFVGLGTPSNQTVIAKFDAPTTQTHRYSTFANFSPYLWCPSGNKFNIFVKDGGAATPVNMRLSVLHYRYKK